MRSKRLPKFWGLRKSGGAYRNTPFCGDPSAAPRFTSPPLGADAPRRPLSAAERGQAERSEARGEVNAPVRSESLATFARTRFVGYWPLLVGNGLPPHTASKFGPIVPRGT